MRAILALLIMVSGIAGASESTRDWHMVSDRDGITVYMAHTDDSNIKTFRGEGEVLMEDFRAIGNMLDDYDFIASWLHMISGLDDLGRVSDLQRHIWVTTRLPWPVSDRDCAIEVFLEQDPDTYTVTIPFVARQDLLEEKDGYVRMPQLEGFLEFEPMEPGKVYMTFQVILDPGGYIPAWLANLILRDIPYFSLKRFRRVASEERFQGSDSGYFKVPPGWPGSDATESASAVSPSPESLAP